jgi:hypothetical protein
MENLIRELVRQADAQDGSWTITRDMILDILEIDIREAYSRITKGGNVKLLEERSRFTSAQNGDLVGFLEDLGYSDAGGEFMRAGLWISVELQIEMQRLCIDRISDMRIIHQVQYQTFADMFQEYPRLPVAQQRYLDEFFSIDSILLWAAKEICDAHSDIDQRAMALLKDLGQESAGESSHIETFFPRCLISRVSSFLRDFCPNISARGPTSGGSGIFKSDDPELTRRRAWAMEVFGIREARAMDRSELRRHYQRLMKRWHPDINWSGPRQSTARMRCFWNRSANIVNAYFPNYHSGKKKS